MNDLEARVARAIGLNLRVMRTRRELSQQQLADAIASKASYLSELENGKHNLSLSMLIRLATVLECELTDLVEGVSIKEAARQGKGRK